MELLLDGSMTITSKIQGSEFQLNSQLFPNNFILDYSHLKQHPYQVVEAMELPKSMSSVWFKCTLDLIEHGQVKKIINRLKRWSGKGQKVVLNLSKYLERFRSAVHYNRYRALGLPIGSGEVESAHRYIPQKRLKIPGATWHPDTINP